MRGPAAAAWRWSVYWRAIMGGDYQRRRGVLPTPFHRRRIWVRKLLAVNQPSGARASEGIALFAAPNALVLSCPSSSLGTHLSPKLQLREAAHETRATQHVNLPEPEFRCYLRSLENSKATSDSVFGSPQRLVATLQTISCLP